MLSVMNKGRFARWRPHLPIRRILSVAFYVLLIVFLGLYLTTIDAGQLRQLDPSWSYLLVATAFALAARYWGVYIWMVLLKGLGAKQLTHKPQLVYAYAKSWLGRYIPGKVVWILGKIHFASQYGISKNKLAVSSLLEAALQVTTILALSFVLLMFDSRLDVISADAKLALAAMLLACIVAMIPPVFNKLIKVTYKIIRKKDLATEHLASSKTIAKGAALYLFGALVSGLSLFFIAKAVHPELGFSSMLYVIGVSNLAGALGMLAVFAPSGLGVREGVQLLLLSLIIPTEVALAVVVATRLWGVIVDFIFLGLAFLGKNIRTK